MTVCALQIRPPLRLMAYQPTDDCCVSGLRLAVVLVLTACFKKVSAGDFRYSLGYVAVRLVYTVEIVGVR